MFSHPAFIFAKVGSNSESKAFFTQQNVSAVTGVDGPNGVIFGEVADVTLGFIDVNFGMKTFYEIVVFTQSLGNHFAHSGHDIHIQNNINGVSQLNTDFCKFATDNTHGIGNDIHCSAFHAATINLGQHVIAFFRIHPVV